MWLNRIIDHRDVATCDLRPHELNFRMHPSVQQEALSAALQELGFIHAVLVSARTMTILNGHLRVELATDAHSETIPATLVDLSTDEENMVLALFDRLAALATTDAGKLRELLSQVSADAPALQSMLSGYADEYGIKIAETVAAIPELNGRAAEAEKTTARIKIGSFRTDVPLATYEAWLSLLQESVGTDESAMVAEVRRRLKIDHPRTV